MVNKILKIASIVTQKRQLVMFLEQCTHRLGSLVSLVLRTPLQNESVKPRGLYQCECCSALYNELVFSHQGTTLIDSQMQRETKINQQCTYLLLENTTLSLNVVLA